MTSRAQLIREYLATQDGPRTTGEIVAGIGDRRTHHAADTIQSMARQGYLTRTKGPHCWLYGMGKPVRRTRCLTVDERWRKRNKAEREKAWAAGRKTWAEHVADLAEKRAQRAAAPKRDRKHKPVADRPARSFPATQLHRDIRAHAEASARKEPPRESVEEWMARTGMRPEVLAIGQVSKPLTRINDHRAQNQAAWNNRERKAA